MSGMAQYTERERERVSERKREKVTTDRHTRTHTHTHTQEFVEGRLGAVQTLIGTNLQKYSLQ